MSVNPNAPLTSVGPPQMMPAGADPAAWSDYLRRYDAYVARTEQAANTASADSGTWERQKLQAQYDDAKKARDNAYQIAQLQSDESRYGVDQQRRTALDQLKQAQRQFDATHALDMQKFGLNVAEDYTKYASTPDLTFQRADLMEGLSRAGIGQGPAPLSAVGQPTQKTWNDWAALQGWATPTVQAGQTQPPAGASSANGAGASAGSSGSGSGTDPRVAASNAIMKAIPPSAGAGHDQSDFAALQAIKHVYSAALPGSYERLRPGQQAAFQSGLSRLGYYAPDALADMKRAGVGQGNVRSA